MSGESSKNSLAFKNPLVAFLVFLCRFWQILLSPLFGPRCRFYPTCSHYAVESFEKHGLLKGALLTTSRLCRCHPFAQGGIDCVPQRIEGLKSFLGGADEREEVRQEEQSEEQKRGERPQGMCGEA